MKQTNCKQCYFSPKYCLCLKIRAPIKLPFRIIFVMNKSEFFKLSNSAKLFLLNCYPCEIRIRGLKKSPLCYDTFSDELINATNYLLYPHKESKKIDASSLLDSKEKINFIVPDGNWSQAAKIAHKLQAQNNITPIALEKPPISQYQLRKNPNLNRISTFEATFSAIQKQLKESEQTQLINCFQDFVNNVLRLRGKLKKNL